MKVQLVRNEGCHIWQKAEEELKAALREAGLPEDYEVVVVKTDDEASRYHFFGSPQITINGEDIDPSASSGQASREFQTLGCRIYIWQGKMYEYPPKEMILEALGRASARSGQTE